MLSGSLSALVFTAAAASATVHLCGDSTMARGNGIIDGWGQYLQYSLNEPVVNHAVGGRSARSFTREGRFDEVLAQVESGDFVVIEFGHVRLFRRPKVQLGTIFLACSLICSRTTEDLSITTMEGPLASEMGGRHVQRSTSKLVKETFRGVVWWVDEINGSLAVSRRRFTHSRGTLSRLLRSSLTREPMSFSQKRLPTTLGSQGPSPGRHPAFSITRGSRLLSLGDQPREFISYHMVNTRRRR